MKIFDKVILFLQFMWLSLRELGGFVMEKHDGGTGEHGETDQAKCRQRGKQGARGSE